MYACVFVHFRVFIAHLLRGGETVAQPIQAVQIYYEHPFGAERVLLICWLLSKNDYDAGRNYVGEAQLTR